MREAPDKTSGIEGAKVLLAKAKIDLGWGNYRDGLDKAASGMGGDGSPSRKEECIHPGICQAPCISAGSQLKDH